MVIFLVSLCNFLELSHKGIREPLIMQDNNVLATKFRFDTQFHLIPIL